MDTSIQIKPELKAVQVKLANNLHGQKFDEIVAEMRDFNKRAPISKAGFAGYCYSMYELMPEEANALWDYAGLQAA